MTSPEPKSEGLLLKRLIYWLLRSLKTFLCMIWDTHYSNLSKLKTFHLKTRRSFEWDNESVTNSRGISHNLHINKKWSRVWRKREVYEFVHIWGKRSRLHTYYKLKTFVYCVITCCRLACRHLVPPPSSGPGRVDYPEDGDSRLLRKAAIRTTTYFRIRLPRRALRLLFNLE